MAEFLVLKVARSTRTDPAEDAGRYKQGDVIGIQEDGYPWSEVETNHPDAKIVKAPGIPKADFLQLLSPTAGGSDEHRRVRMWKFSNIVSIPATVNLPNATSFIATHCEQHPAIPVSGIFDINLRPVR